jgi:hypothetical protein
MPPQSGPGGLAVMASMEVPAGRPVAPRWGLLAVWCQFAMTIFH